MGAENNLKRGDGSRERIAGIYGTRKCNIYNIQGPHQTISPKQCHTHTNFTRKDLHFIPGSASPLYPSCLEGHKKAPGSRLTLRPLIWNPPVLRMGHSNFGGLPEFSKNSPSRNLGPGAQNIRMAHPSPVPQLKKNPRCEVSAGRRTSTAYGLQRTP